MDFLLLTVGHGKAGQAEFARLLRDGGVARVVDVRRFPGSRAHPHFVRDELGRWLPAEGIAYRWEPRLGGRRRLPTASPDVWWQVDAFRAYADHMRGAEFADAMDDLVADTASAATAVMCSESVWWRCHRRLIADHAALVRGGRVRHLMHDGRLVEHRVAEGARIDAELGIVYDRP